LKEMDQPPDQTEDQMDLRELMTEFDRFGSWANRSGRSDQMGMKRIGDDDAGTVRCARGVLLGGMGATQD
jgi:hypothetical protein